MKDKPIIILTGGGTAGHIMPNIALFEKYKSKYDFIYIGSKDSMEEKLVEKIMPFYHITTTKLIRKLTLKNFKIPFELIKGINEAKKLLKDINPSLIFSKGGFVSVPVVLAGKKLGIHCITHESDLTMGLANKLIKNKCDYVCSSFQSTTRYLKNGVWTGTPLRSQLFCGDRNKILSNCKFDKNKKTIMVFGGSLGSRNINELIFKNIHQLDSYNIIHIVGKGNTRKVDYKNYLQKEFVDNIQDYFACSDLVITRGGSNAINELLALKKLMIIIPLSKAQSRGDQILNSEYFKSKGYAEMILEENMNISVLKKTINSMLKNPELYISNMTHASKNGCIEIEKLFQKLIKRTD